MIRSCVWSELAVSNGRVVAIDDTFSNRSVKLYSWRQFFTRHDNYCQIVGGFFWASSGLSVAGSLVGTGSAIMHSPWNLAIRLLSVDTFWLEKCFFASSFKISHPAPNADFTLAEASLSFLHWAFSADIGGCLACWQCTLLSTPLFYKWICS